MSFLAGTFLAFIAEEKAFICFANLVHSNYFLNLFRGNIV